MTESKITEERKPPYIPLATLTNFIGKLKKTVVPPVIDASLTRNMSGGMSGALMTTLKFLGLIDQAGKVQAALKALVDAYDTEAWKGEFGKVVQASYKHIVEGIDLEKATSGQLEDQFKAQGKVEGQMAQKSVRFYLAALSEIGAPLSPHFKARKARATNGARKTTKKTAMRKSTERDDEEHKDSHETQRFEIPIPNKSPAKITVPADLDAEDWQMLHEMLAQYVLRWKKFRAPKASAKKGEAEDA